jgi:hypothetical protein
VSNPLLAARRLHRKRRCRFRYYVFDETKTDKLHYEHAYDFTIYDFAGRLPHLMFYTEYRIYGCAQDSFTYTVEHCEQDIPRERFNKFLDAIREIPPKTLQELRGNETERSHGWLTLDDTDHTINARLTDSSPAKLHTLILTFLDEVAPKDTRKTSTRTIEGDLVPALAVTFDALLRAPEQFDGKRVRLTGYYHYEFEGATSALRRKPTTKSPCGSAALLLSPPQATSNVSMIPSLRPTALSQLALAVTWVSGPVA